MWFFSKNRKLTENINSIIQDCDETIRHLNYFATQEVREKVARIVLEQTYTISLYIAYEGADGRSQLEATLQSLTMQRQQAAGKVLKNPHPRADFHWSSAALTEGFLQVHLFANNSEQKSRLSTLLSQWFELVLGRSKMDKILATLNSNITS